jgi:signal peptide peptidase-like 2B
MVCTDSTEANITIPVVMITKSAGEALNASLTSGRRGKGFDF